MIEYLFALILGSLLGFLIEQKKKDCEREKRVVSNCMNLSLFILIFLLGFIIGKNLSFEELAEVGQISLVFAITSMFFSYTFSKILFRIVKIRSRG
jgi:uncharacterized membrane protein YadS